MTTARAKRKLVAEKPVEKMPLHVRRDTIVFQRAHRVFGEVTSIIEGPTTRTQFKDHIEALLTEAGCAFCDYLYAEANGKRAEAVRRWEEVQGLVEYELPMCLLRPVTGLKQRRSRERAAMAVVRIIAAEMPDYRQHVEAMYAKAAPDESRNRAHAVQRPQLSKSIRRPEKSRFQEFVPWAESVIMATFSIEEIHDERKYKPSRTGTCKS